MRTCILVSVNVIVAFMSVSMCALLRMCFPVCVCNMCLLSHKRDERVLLRLSPPWRLICLCLSARGGAMKGEKRSVEH